MTVDQRLYALGVVLPLLERDEWAHIDSDSPVGSQICALWLGAADLWKSCPDTCETLRGAMLPHLVRQCDIWFFG